MRKFLKKIMLFSTIVIVLLGIGELIARNMSNPYRYKDAWLRNNGSSVSTLILGSSHTYYGLKSDMLGDSIFNLANVSQDPEIDLILLRKYLTYMPSLKRVIIPISYFTFVDPPLEKSAEWFRMIEYKVNMDIPTHSDFSIYNFEISDFPGYCEKLKSLILPRPSNRCDSLGWGLGFDLGNRVPDWESRGVERAQATTIHNPERADEITAALEEIIKLCLKRDIECVLITTPVWHTYAGHLDREQLNEMKSRAQSLASSYDIRYYDFFSDEDFKSDDFHDVDHLSDIGAEKLSGKLRSALDSE